jgi:signal transduction histidine kinase/ActR/RegA family two-component response regulator
LVTPNEVDGALALGFLAEHSVAASVLRSISELEGELPMDAGCLVLVEEALLDADAERLRQLLEAQPSWSDLPLVLVASQGRTMSAALEPAFPHAGNVTMLERPLNPLTLVSAVRVGLRARARQLEVHNLLREREQALRQRDDFLAMLAHELRNPLAPMRNAIWLQRQTATQDQVIAKTRDILERQVNHMSRLVDDLVDLARLERGKIKLQLQHFDMNAAVRAALDACAPMIKERSHAVETSLANEPLFVEADPVRLEQLLLNLLVNACKFTPPGGRIEVRTWEQAATVFVSVADNGLGMKPEQIESLFSPFVQGETSLARSAGGLGVGLSIARTIAQLHRGSLHASSNGPNTGAVFEVALPRSEPLSQPLDQQARAALDGPRQRVLVIEDNEDIRESLRMVLTTWGHEVVLAASGHEGLALALEVRPDVALIDIGLPGMSRYEVARQIRAQGNGSHLIAMTGYGAPADRARAAEAGFHQHLIKPVDPEALRPLLAARSAPPLDRPRFHPASERH